MLYYEISEVVHFKLIFTLKNQMLSIRKWGKTIYKKKSFHVNQLSEQ